jgi:hypothetical protein
MGFYSVGGFIGQLITGLLTRIMISGFGINWTQFLLFYCKFRTYIFFK